VVWGSELSQAGGQEPVVDSGKELRGVEAVVGDPVAVCAGDAGDQAAGCESAQVIGYLPGGELARLSPRSSLVSARRCLLANPSG
jgi:hypothetical protein